MDQKLFILLNGKHKVRDWLGFTKNFSLRAKGHLNLYFKFNSF